MQLMMSYPVTPRTHFPKVATGINKNECPLSVESSTLKCTIGAFIWSSRTPKKDRWV